MDPFATDPHGLLRPAELLHAGRDDRSLRRAVDRKSLARVVPGVFADHERWHDLDRREQHVLRAHAILPRLGPETVFSHATAAAIHGYPWLKPWPADLETTDRVASCTRRRKHHLIHALRLTGSEVMLANGLPVTTPARTAVDLAIALPFRDAIVTLDAAFADERFSPEDFDLSVVRRSPIRGHLKVARARMFADARSGSAGESLSRVIIDELGRPAPELQVEFADAHGRIGIVDFFWPGFGLVGEFDGVGKYQREEFLRGMSPGQAVVKEKWREDRLRAHPDVQRVVRWGWPELVDPRLLLATLTRARLPRR